MEVFILSSFFNFFKKIIYELILFIIFICVFFIPSISSTDIQLSNNEYMDIKLNPNGFIWPTPGYTKINCPFGKRKAPTSGASTYHKGIDIGAPEGSSFVAVCDGEITFTDFLGGGGYTITLSTGNLKITYCHVNPNYIVSVGDIVKQGQVIRKSWSKICLWC